LQYSYIARQPILDAHKNLVAYELLFRDGPNNKFPDIEAEQATSRLLSEHFFAVHNQDSQQVRTFVNFPYQSLINLVPTLLPKENLVVEILEDCEPNQELLNAVKILHHQGYCLALDDFIPSPKWKVFLPYISIIKFDIRLVPINKAKILLDKLKHTPIQFLAEKVETHGEFELALEAGFSLFQGYFFSKPELIRNKKIDPSVITIIQLCKEVAKTNIDFNAIEALMTKDVSLSFKLLTLVNDSANMALEITSFKQAIVYLGEQKLRKFISLLAIASTANDKPQYLYNLSLQTARFCELMATQTQGKINPASAFLSGMFSYLDSLLDQPLEELLNAIHVEKSVKQALLSHSGSLGLLIRLAKAYDKADWHTVQDISEQLELNIEQVASCYDNAIAWVSELFVKID
jgi:EAL and modified HD-GYP domain-containing signal transduction protein